MKAAEFKGVTIIKMQNIEYAELEINFLEQWLRGPPAPKCGGPLIFLMVLLETIPTNIWPGHFSVT